MRINTISIRILPLIILVSSCTEKYPAHDVAGWDFNHLRQVKKAIADSGSYYYPAFAAVVADADEALESGPYSVTYKSVVPPGGSKHDYMSMGPYWWPDSSKQDGLPYIRHDGVRNPEAAIDREQYGNLVNSTRSLTLAWYLTGKKEYADKAAELLRVWFIDTATLMKPHLEFAQGIPGITKGRGIGIIDIRGMYTLTDAITLLDCSGAMKAGEMDVIRKWFSDLFTWLTTSANGLDEDDEKNNHSVAYDVTVCSIARFLGNDEYASKKISEIPLRRIEPMIEADGSQPAELARTNGWGYSVMNLNQFFDAGVMGLKINRNIFLYSNSKGGSVRGALDFLIGFIDNRDDFRWQQIGDWDGPQNRLGLLIRTAAWIYQEPRYEKLWMDRFYESMKSDWSLLVTPDFNRK